MAAYAGKAFYAQKIDLKCMEQSQDLEFHSFFQNEISNFTNSSYLPSSTNVDAISDPFLMPNPMRQSISPGREMTCTITDVTIEDEPPLLEELEIYPDRIVHKSCSILNPFRKNDLAGNTAYLFQETDLAGPIVFCLVFGVCLFVSGSKVHFGYIYGLSVISVVGMYTLLLLLCNEREHFLSLGGVASAMGYGFLPVVWLSIVGIFISLNTTFGFGIALLSVALATMGASRMLCLMGHEPKQRFLIAYPCALVYVAFTFLALF